MPDLVSKILHTLLMAAGMFWQVGWSLVLGFLISAALQVFVSKEKMSALLGKDGIKEISLAMLFGACSSSCSYASAAVMRTLLRKGAGFLSALAFLFASTNLVIELGVVLFLLMGWAFMVGEWVGGIVLVAIMSLLVRLTCPPSLIEEARQKAREGMETHDHGAATLPGSTLGAKMMSREGRLAVAQNFVSDGKMLWKDLALGFLIAGALTAFVPQGVWQSLFVTGENPLWQGVLNAMIGPLIAMLSFVCSIGNVPMAAVLWGSGISFGGVLSFLYADLIVLPLLDVYRRSFGLKMAAYMGVLFYVTMVLAGLVMDAAFAALGLLPTPPPLGVSHEMMAFSVNYTFWLNLVFGVIAFLLFRLAAKGPAGPKRACCCH